MTISEMFGQSGVLALLGMAVVFGFLTLLIICISVMGKIIHALGLDKEEVPKSAAASQGSGVQGPVVAAIGAALKAHRGE